MKKITLIGLCMLIILVGCEKQVNVLELRPIDECNGFESLNKTFEVDYWDEFKEQYNLQVSNYEWCLELIDCGIKTERKTVCEDKVCDFANSEDSLFKCPDCRIIETQELICQ